MKPKMAEGRSRQNMAECGASRLCLLPGFYFSVNESNTGKGLHTLIRIIFFLINMSHIYHFLPSFLP